MNKYYLLIAAVALSLWNCSSNESTESGELRISEIFYNSIPRDTFEFIELYNGSDKAVELALGQLKSGVSYTFSADVPALALEIKRVNTSN